MKCSICEANDAVGPICGGPNSEECRGYCYSYGMCEQCQSILHEELCTERRLSEDEEYNCDEEGIIDMFGSNDYRMASYKSSMIDCLIRSKSQMSLGKLIDTLSLIDPTRAIVKLDEPASYRGYYTDLAFSMQNGTMSVGELLKLCKECVGSFMRGYKGGLFKMTTHTPLWIADYGVEGLKVVGIETSTPDLTIITEKDSYD